MSTRLLAKTRHFIQIWRPVTLVHRRVKTYNFQSPTTSQFQPLFSWYLSETIIVYVMPLFLPSPLLETNVLEHLEKIILLIYAKRFNKAAGVLLTLAKLQQTRKKFSLCIPYIQSSKQSSGNAAQ